MSGTESLTQTLNFLPVPAGFSLTADSSCRGRSSPVTVRPCCGRWSRWRWRPADCRRGDASYGWRSGSSGRILGTRPGVGGPWCLRAVERRSLGGWPPCPGPGGGDPAVIGSAGVWRRQSSSFSDGPQRWLQKTTNTEFKKRFFHSKSHIFTINVSLSWLIYNQTTDWKSKQIRFNNWSFSVVPCRHSSYKILSYVLTYVGRDDGEGAQVGLPHVLGQSARVLLVVAQQNRRAALRALEELPVRSWVWRQDGAAHTDQILLESRQRWRVDLGCLRPKNGQSCTGHVGGLQEMSKLKIARFFSMGVLLVTGSSKHLNSTVGEMPANRLDF